MFFRLARNFLLLVLLATLAALALVVWQSGDAFYRGEELLSFGRFHRYDRLIENAGKKYGVDPMLVKAIVWRESRFQPNKIGKNGERGLMQVTEGAAADWAKTNKIGTFVPTDLFAPKTNLEAGTWYLKQALQRYVGKDDPMTFALAEYNAGHRRMSQWLGNTNMGGQATAGDLRDSISIPNTRSYVDAILARYRFYKARGRL